MQTVPRITYPVNWVNLFRNTLEDLTHKKNLLNEQELQFLKMSYSDLTYKEIAVEMQLSPRAVDALGDQLVQSFRCKKPGRFGHERHTAWLGEFLIISNINQ